MASGTGLTHRMDWRDITERLLDPQQRRAIVTKADTDDLQHMKTRNAFTKRKRRLLDQIRKHKLTNANNNTKKPGDKSDRSPNASPPSSRCSELNFSNEEVPSTPPPTLHPNKSLPSANNQHPHGSTMPVPTSASGYDSDTGTIDMGDYENRIRPSSAFWRKKDGMSLAEKIIFYRNWKYRNHPRREDNHQTPGEMESTLTDYRRLGSTRHAAKSAAIPRRRNSLDDDDDRKRPVTVIPKVTHQFPVTFPPIDSGRQAVVTSSRGGDVEMERLPPIENNQFVFDRKGESVAETDIDQESDEEEAENPEEDAENPEEDADNPEDVDNPEDAKSPEDAESPEDTENPKDAENPNKEENLDDTAKDDAAEDDKAQGDDPPVEKGTVSNPASKKRRTKVPRVFGPRAPRPSGEPDKLIAKLNKKVERDLRTLQGQPIDDADDDDDTDVDDDTMNDILNGDRGKEFDKFLQS